MKHAEEKRGPILHSVTLGRPLFQFVTILSPGRMVLYFKQGLKLLGQFLAKQPPGP